MLINHTLLSHTSKQALQLVFFFSLVQKFRITFSFHCKDIVFVLTISIKASPRHAKHSVHLHSPNRPSANKSKEKRLLTNVEKVPLGARTSRKETRDSGQDQLHPWLFHPTENKHVHGQKVLRGQLKDSHSNRSFKHQQPPAL